MNQLARRLSNLEYVTAPKQNAQVVLWAWGSSFAEALRRSKQWPEPCERMLIQLCPVIGGHGKPVTQDWHPEYQAEYDKAIAWSEGQ